MIIKKEILCKYIMLEKPLSNDLKQLNILSEIQICLYFIQNSKYKLINKFYRNKHEIPNKRSSRLEQVLRHNQSCLGQRPQPSQARQIADY